MSTKGKGAELPEVRSDASALHRLNEAFVRGRLTLYLGAGCSVASHVPSWDHLVMQLYVNGIVRRLPRFTSVPALVPSVGQWAFSRRIAPLEVAARKLRGFYRNDADLLLMMKVMLYGLTGYLNRRRLRSAEIHRLLAQNHTLRAVSRLCRQTAPGRRGVQAVVTYNYDDLLEKSLGRYHYQSVWHASAVLEARRLPIFHIHGYVPAGEKQASSMAEVVLTEDQYNRAVQHPYSWQNLAQIHALAGSVGLMVGLSLTDRNLRSILDALRNLPQRVEAYALLQRPRDWAVGDIDIDEIIETMKTRIRHGFETGVGRKEIDKLGTRALRNKILSMVRELEDQDLKQEEAMLTELGVHPIWYEDHAEVEQFIERILPAR